MKIGVIVSGLFEDYNRNIYQGIITAAEKENVQIVLITGKYLGFDLTKEFGLEYEYQYNTCFEYGGSLPFDGLIVEMASTTMYANEDIKAAFVKKFSNVPHVFIAHDEEGVGSVSIDNSSGMMEALETMYSRGLRKYVMIGGPVDNEDAIQRKDIFFEFLRKHELDASSSVYEDGDFVMDCTEKINALLDRNGKIDAFICANDVLARSVSDILTKRGITVGQDMAVLGYDDSVVAGIRKPALSSVRSDFYALGSEAFCLLMRVLNGGAPEQIKVPTKFIERSSTRFGIGEIAISGEKSVFDARGLEQAVELVINDSFSFDDMLKKDAVWSEKDQKDILRKAYEDILHTAAQFMAYTDRHKEFFDILDRVLDEGYSSQLVQFIDTGRIFDRMDSFRKSEVFNGFSLDIKLFVQEILLTIQSSLMDQINYITDTQKYLATYVYANQQRYYRDTFFFEHGDDSTYAQILSNPGFFKIKNAFLYVYNEPIYNLYEDEFQVPKYLYLKAVMRNGETIAIPSSEQLTPRKYLIDNKYFTWDSYDRMVMFPIFVKDLLYGVLFCDMEPSAFLASGTFVCETSAAIKLLSVLRESEKLLQTYEDTLQVLQSNNIRLEKLSNLDMLTGLVNRRGFMAQAEKLFNEAMQIGRNLMLIYVDMNNLKIINDRYGHDDGDFALEQIGILLKKRFGESGVAGRIGGDEFACALICEDCVTEEEIVSDIYADFIEFNRKSDKPYKVEVGAGICKVEAGSEITLEQAIDIADENLYKEKRLRTKSVLKTETSLTGGTSTEDSLTGDSPTGDSPAEG